MADSVVPSAQTTTVAAVAKPAQQALASAGRQDLAAAGRDLPVVATTPGPVQSASPSTQEVERATRDISEYIQTVNRSLQISVDRDIGTTVITVIDSATEEVVRQIPSEDIIALARYLSQQQAELGGTGIPVKGLLMDSEG